MGCSCNCDGKNNDKINEIIYDINDIQPKIITLNEEELITEKDLRLRANRLFIDKKEKNTDSNSSILVSNQERNDILFDIFNEIRTNPIIYEMEAKSYGVLDIIQKYEKLCDCQNSLIKNVYYNLLLEAYTTSNFEGCKTNEELIKIIEQEKQIKNFDKKLYITQSSIDKPEGAVWKLLAENKETAIEEILLCKIDYLIISTTHVNETKNFNAYFLFLKRKNL